MEANYPYAIKTAGASITREALDQWERSNVGAGPMRVDQSGVAGPGYLPILSGPGSYGNIWFSQEDDHENQTNLPNLFSSSQGLTQVCQ